jgi:hypothetical protein
VDLANHEFELLTRGATYKNKNNSKPAAESASLNRPAYFLVEVSLQLVHVFGGANAAADLLF